MKLTKIYNAVLNEELTYRHSNSKGPEDDEYEVGMVEELSLPTMKLPAQLDINDKERVLISKLKVSDLIVNQGSFDGETLEMLISLPWDSTVNDGGIVVEVQMLKVKGVSLYQIHIELSDSIHGLGLGYKVYVALINDLGHLYSGTGRMQNRVQIPKIWGKLSSESNITCHTNELGSVCVLDSNPDKESLLSIIKNN